MLQWAREQDCPWDESTCGHAARGGHLAVLQWARENHCPWGPSTCAYAAQGGHLEMLQWAREHHNCPWDEATCRFAAGGGRLAGACTRPLFGSTLALLVGQGVRLGVV